MYTTIDKYTLKRGIWIMWMKNITKVNKLSLCYWILRSGIFCANFAGIKVSIQWEFFTNCVFLVSVYPG